MRLSSLYDRLAGRHTGVDAILTTVLILASTVTTIPVRHSVWAALSMSVLAFGPLVLRRRLPATTFIAVNLALVALTCLDRSYASSFVEALPFALYALAAYSDSRLLRCSGLVAFWIWPATLLDDPATWNQRLFSVVLAGGLGTAVWLMGDVVRQRRQIAAHLAEQQQALARDQAQGERLAAQDERARIAREMHDIVAHNLSLIVAQADEARYVAAQGPQAATGGSRRALQTIAATARSALADTRSLVGVLREGDPLAEYRPTETLADVDALVAGVAATGLDVTIQHNGPIRPVPAEVGLAAYRIVQESLTNVIKHAGRRSSATVTVDHADPLGIIVQDDGAATEPAPPGQGLIGMRERVDAVHGSLQTGPVPGGGYRVSAYLPLHDHEERHDG